MPTSRSGSTSSTRSSIPSPRITTSCSQCWRHRCRRPGIIIRRVFTVERGLFAAPSLLQRFGKPRTLADLARLPLLAGANDTAWVITPPGAKPEHVPVEHARLVSSHAHIRPQAAMAGYGVLRVTASFTRAAVESGSLRRFPPDQICEPLSVHALLPARQLVPAKVRAFLAALDVHAHGPQTLETEPLPG